MIVFNRVMQRFLFYFKDSLYVHLTLFLHRVIHDKSHGLKDQHLICVFILFRGRCLRFMTLISISVAFRLLNCMFYCHLLFFVLYNKLTSNSMFVYVLQHKTHHRKYLETYVYCSYIYKLLTLSISKIIRQGKT